MNRTDNASSPAPNLDAALPRRHTYFGRRAAELISLLQSSVATEDALREIDRLESFLDDRLYDWDYFGRNEQFFYKEAGEGLDALERARARLQTGDRHGALSEVEAASFTRRTEHVQAAYDRAMGAANVV